jgi:hypothetical protein
MSIGHATIMTAVSITAANPRLRGVLRAGAIAAAAITAALALGGCYTEEPKPLAGASLAEAETFPYFKVYWAGPKFGKWPLAAADGTRSYQPAIGDSVYYGNCITGKGLLAGGNCAIPLQVTTLIYALHNNVDLGKQQNVLLRGVPAVVFDNGHSIELYTERVVVDVFSYSYRQALKAVEQLRPINAPGSATANLPPPVFCPGLEGEVPEELQVVLNNLPGRACQEDEAQEVYTRRIKGESVKGAY